MAFQGSDRTIIYIFVKWMFYLSPLVPNFKHIGCLFNIHPKGCIVLVIEYFELESYLMCRNVFAYSSNRRRSHRRCRSRCGSTISASRVCSASTCAAMAGDRMIAAHSVLRLALSTHGKRSLAPRDRGHIPTLPRYPRSRLLRFGLPTFPSGLLTNRKQRRE